MPLRLAAQSELRRQKMRQVAEVLADAPGLTDARGLHQWRRELSLALGGRQWPALPTPHQEFLEAVHVCESQQHGLHQLLQATVLVAPLLEHSLAPLVEELQALQLYEDRDWTALRTALTLALPELDTTVARVTGGRVRLPPYCTTAWHAFVHLSGRTTPPDSVLPPGMVLLEHLSLISDLASHVGELQAWNDHFAERWQLADVEGGLRDLRNSLSNRSSSDTGAAVRAGAPTPPVPPVATDLPEDAVRPVIRLYIKLAPDLAPLQGAGRRQARRKNRYWVSARVKYTESPELHHAQEGEAHQPVLRGQVPGAVADLLTRMASLWHTRSEEVVLEFFLPTELLNEPVEWWDRDPSLAYPNPLFSKYPDIVVHSLERLQRKDAFQVWRHRWARWKDAADSGDSVHWCDREGRAAPEHLRRLDAAIGARKDVMAMVLSEPPAAGNTAGLGEVRVGIDLGIPVFIHHRDSVSDQFRSMVRDGLTEGGLAGFPSHARQWKSDSATREKSSAHDPAQHLCVVWDDPEHLLGGGAGAPAAFVGGIE
ncbi:effector-associated domain 2-containing protein [Streptomyces sp. enrichment culture]|uniref:VMAP-C domain-containing protein n=1 Tax=Streptomyces sp. enrichment culture TaxID=1795815 RepID=UPI003F57AFC9